MDTVWEQKLEQMLHFIYQQVHLDPADTYDFAKEIADALQYVLAQRQLPGQLTDVLDWIGKVYSFAVEWCFDRDICGDYSYALEYCERAFGQIFHTLAPAEREQMRLWFLGYIEHTYPENLYYIVSFFLRFPWNAEKENLQALSKRAGRLSENHPLHRLLAERQGNPG